MAIKTTHNIGSFKSQRFVFYVNAQFPHIMKQQTIDDSDTKDLFGVITSGNQHRNRWPPQKRTHNQRSERLRPLHRQEAQENQSLPLDIII